MLRKLLSSRREDDASPSADDILNLLCTTMKALTPDTNAADVSTTGELAEGEVVTLGIWLGIQSKELGRRLTFEQLVSRANALNSAGLLQAVQPLRNRPSAGLILAAAFVAKLPANEVHNNKVHAAGQVVVNMLNTYSAARLGG